MQWKAINGASLLTGLPTALNTALHYDLLLRLVAFEPETKHPVTYTHYNPEVGLCPTLDISPLCCVIINGILLCSLGLGFSNLSAN